MVSLVSFVDTSRVYQLAVVILLLTTIQYGRKLWRLRYIPGPFLASLSDLQRTYWMSTKRAHLIHQILHDKWRACAIGSQYDLI